MKKHFLVVLVTLIPLFFLFQYDSGYAAKDGLLIEVTAAKADVFDNRTGKLVKVGELYQGEVYPATRDYGENWYEIQYADYKGYVAKINVKSASGKKIRNVATDYRTINKVVNRHNDVVVYDNSTGTLIPFAVINKDTPYPAFGTLGNWYKLNVAGRVGFVHKSNIELDEQTQTPPANNDKSNLLFEVIATKADIFDNRTGKLVKIGELSQGEVFKATRDYGDNWFEVQYADYKGYVAKMNVKSASGKKVRNAATDYTLINKVVNRHNDVVVYDNSTGTLIPFAIISKDTPYPAFGTLGNWYKLNVAGRIGFVHKSNIELDEQTPPIDNGQTDLLFEVTAAKADIFDNRTGKLVKAGELYQGEVFKAIRDYGENWYEIQYADRKGYITKINVNRVTNKRLINENKHYAPIGDVVKPKQDVVAYDNSSGELIPFAIIAKNTTYPILNTFGNWYTIDVAGRIGFIHKNNTTFHPNKIKTTNIKKVPVLMYHHLLRKNENTFPNNNVVLNVENFEAQMQYLQTNGFHTITVDDLVQYMKGEINLKEKSVLITIDDGHKSNHLYALPILKKYDFQAAAFVITSRVSEHPVAFNPTRWIFLSLPEINEMKTNFEIGSHTFNLHNLDNNRSHLLTKPRQVVLNDLVKSGEFLNAKYFCYPFGQYNETSISLVKQSGYQAAFTTKEGYTTTRTNPYEIPRFGIYPSTSINDFAKIVNGKK